MIIQSMCLGMVMTNVYFLQNEKTKEMLIVDPADMAESIIKKIESSNGVVRAVLLTHGHFDHIYAAEEVAEKYGVPIIAHENEKQLLEDPLLNMSAYHGRPVSLKAGVFAKDGDELELAGLKFRVLHTPGHTSGSCCFYFYEEGVLISGDTLFFRSCGRTDFATSSPADMQKSLIRLVSTLPGETKVYPGHDRDTTIGDEKRFNPFV